MLASKLVHKGGTRILAPSERQRTPTELVEDVFDIVLDHFSNSATPFPYRKSISQPALRAIACLSRHWYKMATEVLYRHIFVASRVALGMLAATMSDSNNEQLVHYVQSLQTGADVFEGFYEADKSDNDEWIRNYQCICDVCPSLTFVHITRRCNDVGDIIDASYVGISKLTHLDVSLAGNLPRGDRWDSSCLGPIAKLPAMQELTIRVWKDGPTAHEVQNPELNYVVLPAMPYLRRLSVVGWDDRYARGISFRIDYPPLRVLEFINCRIDTLYNLPMVEAMERLVVTGIIRRSSSLENGTSFFGRCAALTHLCIPISIFKLQDSELTLPSYLRHFFLDGSIDEDEIKVVENLLVGLFTTVAIRRMDTRQMRLITYLQHVHIVSSDVVRKDKSTFKYEWNSAAEAAKKANVIFTVGIEGLQRHSKLSQDYLTTV